MAHKEVIDTALEQLLRQMDSNEHSIVRESEILSGIGIRAAQDARAAVPIGNPGRSTIKDKRCVNSE